MEVTEFFRMFAVVGGMLTAVLLVFNLITYPPDSERI
jgi:hypothetical protein